MERSFPTELSSIDISNSHTAKEERLEGRYRVKAKTGWLGGLPILAQRKMKWRSLVGLCGSIVASGMLVSYYSIGN